MVGVRMLGRVFPAHRIAFALMGVEVPDGMVIDHINGDPFDNRWCNLRLATLSQNAHNAALSRANTSGHKGVSWNERAQKWWVRIRLDRRCISIGLFDDLSEAAVASEKASRDIHGEYSSFVSRRMIPSHR